MTPEDSFNRIWDRLAYHGHCDERGGAEYQRVLAEWVADGRISHVQYVADFIRRRANIGPVAPGEGVSGGS